MFSNCDSKENCYKFLRDCGLRTNNGKVFYEGGTYYLRYGEFSPREFVVRYRKKVDGVNLYGVYVREFFYSSVCRSVDNFRFLDEHDIESLLYPIVPF